METNARTIAPSCDADLIVKAQADIKHFEPLYDRYFNAVFRFVHQRMESSDDAADVTSDVFLKAMSGIVSYKITACPFVSWLFVIARNEVAGFYRRKKTEQRYYTSQEGMERMAGDIDYEVSQSYFPLKRILELLPAKDFELIDLKYFNSKSIREMSEITGMNENRIRVKLHRIRERLGKMIMAKSGELSSLMRVLAVILVFNSIIIIS